MKKIFFIGAVISIFIITFVFIINLISGGMVTYFYKELVFSQKSDEDKVSKRFDMDISRVTHAGRDYIFYGKDKENGDEKYIVLAFVDGQYHEVFASEGINLYDAIELAVENNYEINCSDLVLMDTFRNDLDGNILEHLDWFVYRDSKKGSLRIDFLTGEIKDYWLNYN